MVVTKFNEILIKPWMKFIWSTHFNLPRANTVSKIKAIYLYA